MNAPWRYDAGASATAVAAVPQDELGRLRLRLVEVDAELASANEQRDIIRQQLQAPVSLPHALTHARRHTQTHAHTHARTHTHTLSLSLSHSHSH